MSYDRYIDFYVTTVEYLVPLWRPLHIKTRPFVSQTANLNAILVSL